MLVDIPTNVDINRSMCISSEKLGLQNTTYEIDFFCIFLQGIFVQTLFLI